ncbi:MAG TPA: alpha/beta hydrolase [Flavisolibacter sp.]
MNLYLISGLGADRRAFEKLALPPHHTIHHIEWIPPLPKETLENYAHRLTAGIETSKPFVLVGLSFGGMIATAMNKWVTPRLTILISSISSYYELPWYFRLCGRLRIHRLVPRFLLREPGRIVYGLFGARTPYEKKLLSVIMSETDPRFIRWSLDAIFNWRPWQCTGRVVHLHGDRDKILPLKYTSADHIIEKGSHFMVMTRAQKISEILTGLLNDMDDQQS